MEEIKDKLDRVLALLVKVNERFDSLHPSVLKPTDFHDSRKGKDADGI